MRWFLLFTAMSCGSPTPEPQLNSTANSDYRVASASQLDGAWNNRLAEAQSPYLKMHGQDPVDWFPWGEEAFKEETYQHPDGRRSICTCTCGW